MKVKTLNSDQYIKLAMALVYLISLFYPFSTTVVDSAHYYSVLPLYVSLGFVFFFMLLPVSVLIKLRPHHVKGNIKNTIMLFFVFSVCISATALILFSFWGMIFEDERLSLTNKIEAMIPFCFIAVDLIRLRFFGRKKKGFVYLAANLVISFIILMIAFPVSSVFSFNGLESEQSHGLISAVLFLIASVCFADFLGIPDNSSDDSLSTSEIK